MDSTRSRSATAQGLRPVPMWFALAAALAFVTLLLAFNHVVREGVAAADMRRQASAAQSTALWRCQSVQDRQARDGCIAGVPGGVNGIAATLASAYASF